MRPAKRIDELTDFLEWLANATPPDAAAIRAEIKRYYADVGWDAAAHDLNRKLDIVLRPGVTPDIRQKVLDSIESYARVDPAEYVSVRDSVNDLVKQMFKRVARARRASKTASCATLSRCWSSMPA